MTTTEASVRWDERFIRDLERLVANEDRATLAALRRGLGREPGEAAEMYPYVVPRLPPNAHGREEAAYYVVAALFALHQGSWAIGAGERRATNLGASFRRLAEERDSASIEGRFVALLNSDERDLGEHLRQVVALLKVGEVPVDWLRLLRDIQWWGDARRRVQRAWARGYWGAMEGTDRMSAAVTTDDAPSNNDL